MNFEDGNAADLDPRYYSESWEGITSSGGVATRVWTPIAGTGVDAFVSPDDSEPTFSRRTNDKHMTDRPRADQVSRVRGMMILVAMLLIIIGAFAPLADQRWLALALPFGLLLWFAIGRWLLAKQRDV